MGIDPSAIHRAVAARLDEARALLCELIRRPSPPGDEVEAMAFAAEAFAAVGEVEAVGMTDALRDDADYSDPIEGLTYDGRRNLRVVRPGAGGGKALLLNAHIDAVPPSPAQADPFDPREVDGSITGRGSCDAKGQVATAWLALAALEDLGVRLGGDVVTHVVVEEEIGGNGTVAMVARGEAADGCIVLEPTSLRICTSIRGAVWFRVTLRGEPGHPGRPGSTRNALDMAVRVVEVLRGFHDRLLAESRGDPLFDGYDDPMPLMIGQLHAGTWPSAAAGQAVLAGIHGMLPNKTARQVMDEMTAAIRDEGGPEIAGNFDIRFLYRHDPSVIPADHPLATELLAAAGDVGAAAEIGAMTASCDACYYNNRLGVPTVVFGGGDLADAHSDHEHMPVAALAAAAETLAAMAGRFCGTPDA